MKPGTRLASRILTILTIFVITQYPADCACRRGWEIFGRKCYLYVKERKTFTDAVNYCSGQEAQILDITSEQENVFVSGIISREGEGHQVWLSIIQKGGDGPWLSYSSGKPMSFAKWFRSKPDTHPKPVLFKTCCCGALKADYHKWIKVPCGFTKHFVCEARMKF